MTKEKTTERITKRFFSLTEKENPCYNRKNGSRCICQLIFSTFVKPSHILQMILKKAFTCQSGLQDASETCGLVTFPVRPAN